MEPKGIWQLDFLSENYLAAEKKLLDLSITGKKAGLQTAEELAEQGGYLPGTESSCGKLTNFQFWNKAEKYCFPDVTQNAAALGKAKLIVATGKTFSEVGYDKTLFYGTAGKETIRTKYAHYTYDNAFSVNVGYSFDEYDTLFQETMMLLSQCRGKDLACITNNKPEGWHFDSCSNAMVPGAGTEFAFCVESPSGMMVEGRKLEYQFALDFQ